MAKKYKKVLEPFNREFHLKTIQGIYNSHKTDKNLILHSYFKGEKSQGLHILKGRQIDEIASENCLA